MAVTAHVFPQWLLGVNNGHIAMTGGTYKVALGNSGSVIDLTTSGISTAALFTDWTAIVTEISGAGYTAGGATVSSPTFAAGGSNNSITTWTSASNPNWTSATFTANQAVFYESSATTSQLICFWNFGGAVTVTSSTFTLTISGSGLLTATVS